MAQADIRQSAPCAFVQNCVVWGVNSFMMRNMKKILLLFMGLLPFFLGLSMNALLMRNMNLVLPYPLLGIAWLLLWGLLGCFTAGCAGSVKESSFLAHIIPLVVLLLLLYQELILGQYWFNLGGLATQLYYLPLLNIAFTLTAWAHRVWPAYIASFALMYAVFYWGGCIGKRRRDGGKVSRGVDDAVS
ncbi:hypothetical protein SDC9_71456 [bioreactor metagenome]|uniref:Uncharacterized protein n=1 Tax=bioreactor metagenome TaxID=1076179 RepID=A0A644Y9V8_9ZZZZ